MRTVRKLLPILALAGLVVLITLQSAPAGSAGTTQIPEGALVVDVRTSPEYRSGHHPEAINVPLSSLPKGLQADADKDRQIVVYCRTGSRSAVAKRILEGAGYLAVIDGGSLRQMGL